MTHNETPSSARKDKTAPIVLGVLAVLAIAAMGYVFTQNKGAGSDTEIVEIAAGEFPPMPDTPQGYTSEQANGIEPAASEKPDMEDEVSTEEPAGSAPPPPAEEQAESGLDMDRILGVRAVGDPDAPVRIDEFASLTCSHCGDFHTQTYDALKEKYIDTGKVYFVFNDFPLNKPALDASIVARCLPEERYESFVNLLFKTQRQWATQGYEKALLQNAKLAGLSEDKFHACMDSEELEKGLEQNIQKSRETYDIQSTPTFVFNNGAETIRGASSLKAFDQVINKLNSGGGQ